MDLLMIGKVAIFYGSMAIIASEGDMSPAKMTAISGASLAFGIALETDMDEFRSDSLEVNIGP